jgi:hypothetical protein
MALLVRRWEVVWKNRSFFLASAACSVGVHRGPGVFKLYDKYIFIGDSGK